MAILARAAVLIALAGVAVPLVASAAAGGTATTWSDAVPLADGDSWTHLSAVGARPGTHIVLGVRSDERTTAWISRAGSGWTPATVPPGWALAPCRPDGSCGSDTVNDGCRLSDMASGPDGAVVAVCMAGYYGVPVPAILAPGSAEFREQPLSSNTFFPQQPHIAIGGDGTIVGSVGTTDYKGACAGTAWYGPSTDAGRWSQVAPVEGVSPSVAAGGDGSLVLAGIRCEFTGKPSDSPRLAVAARAPGAPFSNRTLAQPVSDVPTYSAVAPDGRMLVAWTALDRGYRYYEPRWASLGSAVRPGGSRRWECRPVVGQAPCSQGVAPARSRGAGTLGGLRAARVYALAALPDSSFVMLVSGVTAGSGRPGGLYLTRLARGAAAWSPATRLDPGLYVSQGPVGNGPAAVALDRQGGLLAAWAHRNADGSASLRVERLAPGARDFTWQADLVGAGVPFEPALAVPPDGSPSVAWIDAVRDLGAGSEPSGRLLVADA
jgi:hypothetical protein